MAREVASRPFGSSSENIPPPSHNRFTSHIPTRITTKPKKVLGERTDNLAPAPRTALPAISYKPRIALTRPQPPRFARLNSSPAKVATPAPINRSIALSKSQAGFTPHPHHNSRRSSVGFNLAFDQDETMLLDTRPPAFLASDTEDSGMETESEKVSNGKLRNTRGGAVLGEGRLMTPANSQETQADSPVRPQQTQPTRHVSPRYPTPPPSQETREDSPVISRSLVRPRPAPTPPRSTAGSSSAAQSALLDPSPNPRRKKSPRVFDTAPTESSNNTPRPRTQSPFGIPSPASASGSNRSPIDRVEVVIDASRHRSRSNTPMPANKSRGRVAPTEASTPLPRSLLSASVSTPVQTHTSGSSIIFRTVPATAPAKKRSVTPSARKRSSTPQTVGSRRKSTPAPSTLSRSTASPGPPATSVKPKGPRKSRARSRMSLTPAAIFALASSERTLLRPIQPPSPSDDPILLTSAYEDLVRSTPAGPSTGLGLNLGSASGCGKGKGKGRDDSSSVSRVIDFRNAISGLSAPAKGNSQAGPSRFAMSLPADEDDDDIDVGSTSDHGDQYATSPGSAVPYEAEIAHDYEIQIPSDPSSSPAVEESNSQYQQYDDFNPTPAWASDDGSDMEEENEAGGPDDTFMHLGARNEIVASLWQSTLGAASVIEEEESINTVAEVVAESTMEETLNPLTVLEHSGLTPEVDDADLQHDRQETENGGPICTKPVDASTAPFSTTPLSSPHFTYTSLAHEAFPPLLDTAVHHADNSPLVSAHVPVAAATELGSQLLDEDDSFIQEDLTEEEVSVNDSPFTVNINTEVFAHEDGDVTDEEEDEEQEDEAANITAEGLRADWEEEKINGLVPIDNDLSDKEIITTQQDSLGSSVPLEAVPEPCSELQQKPASLEAPSSSHSRSSTPVVQDKERQVALSTATQELEVKLDSDDNETVIDEEHDLALARSQNDDTGITSDKAHFFSASPGPSSNTIHAPTVSSPVISTVEILDSSTTPALDLSIYLARVAASQASARDTPASAEEGMGIVASNEDEEAEGVEEPQGIELDNTEIPEPSCTGLDALFDPIQTNSEDNHPKLVLESDAISTSAVEPESSAQPLRSDEAQLEADYSVELDDEPVLDNPVQEVPSQGAVEVALTITEHFTTTTTTTTTTFLSQGELPELGLESTTCSPKSTDQLIEELVPDDLPLVSAQTPRARSCTPNPAQAVPPQSPLIPGTVLEASLDLVADIAASRYAVGSTPVPSSPAPRPVTAVVEPAQSPADDFQPALAPKSLSESEIQPWDETKDAPEDHKTRQLDPDLPGSGTCDISTSTVVTEEADSANWDTSVEEVEQGDITEEADEQHDEDDSASEGAQDDARDNSGEEENAEEEMTNAPVDRAISELVEVSTADQEDVVAETEASENDGEDENEDVVKDEELEDTRREAQADETSAEEEEDSEVEEEPSPSPPPLAEKIVLKVITRTIKVEPDHDNPEVSLPPASPAPTSSDQQAPARSLGLSTPTKSASIYPALPPSPALIRSAGISISNETTPAPAATLSSTPAVPSTARQSSSASPAPVLRRLSSHSPQSTSALEDMLARKSQHQDTSAPSKNPPRLTRVPSRLSQQVLPSPSPDNSPARPTPVASSTALVMAAMTPPAAAIPTRLESTQGSDPRSHIAADSLAASSSLSRAGPSSQSSSQGPVSEFTQSDLDQSIRIRPIERKSLAEELARSTGSRYGGYGGSEDDSLNSVVEVSSLDPRAAARAAAILKMNHAYIEHGILDQAAPAAMIPKPITTATPRRQSFQSTHFDSIESARKLDKTDLLYEAELEIVATHRDRENRSRSRSMSRFHESQRGVSVAPSEVYFPGGWVATPKRKRAALPPIAQSPAPPAASTRNPKELETGPNWGVKEWKKLEKVYRAEKESWMKEREVKALPLTASTGLLGWARRKTLGGTAEVEVKVKEWDWERVVQRFMAEAGNDWSRDTVTIRVKALEKRVEAKLAEDALKSSTKLDITEPSSKKARHDLESLSTPARSGVLGDSTASSTFGIEPPSTIRRMFGWVMPSRNPQASTPAPGQTSMAMSTSMMIPQTPLPQPRFVSTKTSMSTTVVVPSSDDRLVDVPASVTLAEPVVEPSTAMKQVSSNTAMISAPPAPIQSTTPPSTPPSRLAPLPSSSAVHLPHPSSATWTPPTQPARSAPSLLSQARPASPRKSTSVLPGATANSSSSRLAPTPTTLSAILAASTSSTNSDLDSSTSSNHRDGNSYNFERSLKSTESSSRINSSLSQRSEAINKLFGASLNGSGAKGKGREGMPISIPGGGGRMGQKASVSDLVRSFEESGALSKSTGRGSSAAGSVEDGSLRRVQSRPA